jgi:hypothetical protein
VGEPTRRELLLAATTVPTPADETLRPPSDVELVTGLAGIELLAQFVYRRALDSGVLTDHMQRLSTQIAAHERAHAQALSSELARLGGAPPGAPTGDGDAETALAQHHIKVEVAALPKQRQWLHLMLEMEDVLERNYHAAIVNLRRPRLLRLASSIIASEAQHSAVLGRLLHPGEIDKALPNAFVNGT